MINRNAVIRNAVIRNAVFTQFLMLLLFAPTFGSAQEEEAVQVFRKVSPSVVGLVNPEGSGTGLIINSEGYILTNAHVVSSPLPYQCNVEVESDGKKKLVVFRKVQIIAVHPLRDLAIAKIDPGEHKVRLVSATVEKQKAIQGQRVYAIGNPAAGGKILTKTITVGLLSGVDREIEKVNYYQVDAAVNPGNSGGPLVNRKGNVLGLVTSKFWDADNVGFATPFFDLSTADFEKVGALKPNREVAEHYTKEGIKQHAEALKIAQSLGFGSNGALYGFYRSANSFRQALRYDPQNAKIYASFGTTLRLAGNDPVSEIYLRFCLQIDPWLYDDARVYNQLGLALSGQKKLKEAANCWEEGTRKAPMASERCWTNLAIYHLKSKAWGEALYCAQVADFLGGPRSDPVKISKIISQANQQLDDQGKQLVAKRVENIEVELRELAETKKASFEEKVRFLSADFKAYMNNFGTYTKPKVVDLPKFSLAEAFSGGSKKEPVEPKIRTWVDQSGKYKVEATLVELRDTKVVLKKKNGVTIEIALERLSDDDQTFLKSLGK